jgi:hypothetical protein
MSRDEASVQTAVDRQERSDRELTDAELECIAAGKELGGTGQGSSALRGFPAPGYGNDRGYDSYGTHIG